MSAELERITGFEAALFEAEAARIADEVFSEAKLVCGRPLTADEERVVDAALAGLRRHEIAAERARQSALFGTRSPVGVLERIAEDYKAQGLRPIIDPALEVVLSDCLECHAQATDPLEVWRPLWTVPRETVTILDCRSCGWRRVLES